MAMPCPPGLLPQEAHSAIFNAYNMSRVPEASVDISGRFVNSALTSMHHCIPEMNCTEILRDPEKACVILQLSSVPHIDMEIPRRRC
eukprot:gene11035-biopygen4695